MSGPDRPDEVRMGNMGIGSDYVRRFGKCKEYICVLF